MANLFSKKEPMPSADQLKLFIVDDDPFCLYMFEKHMQNLGYKNVKTFDKGEDCLANLSSAPDVIFLDHEMSPMSGLELMKTIKKFLPGTYIVFVSGQENVETVIRSMQQGAYEYIFKGEHELENIARVMTKIIEAKGMNKKGWGKFFSLL